MPHPYYANEASLVESLQRIEGEVQAIERMIEADRYCVDVLTQIAAASTALESVAHEILDEHVNGCVADALESHDRMAGAGKSLELLDAVMRFTSTR
jgi:DNA-binding FrmR family transcriptional regulator